MALRLASRRSLSLCEPCKRCSKAPRIVEPLGLAGESPAVLLVIGQDVKHGLPLVGEALVGFVQVAHDVEHRAALLVALPEAAFQRLHERAESTLGRRSRSGPPKPQPMALYRDLRHRHQLLPPSAFRLPP